MTDLRASGGDFRGGYQWGAKRTDSNAAPTCRPRRKATSTGWAWALRTCSTMSWRFCTTHPTGRPTLGAADGVASHPAARLA